VLLRGAPGIGKSTTLDALGRRLSGVATNVLRTAADASQRQRPYGLASALLELPVRYPPPADVEDQLLGAVETRCGAGPLALLADDVHQSDGDSLRLLATLASATGDLPLVLVLAYRPLPVRSGLVELESRPDLLVASVTGLDDLGVRDVVESVTGAPPGESLTSLLSIAAGNPFHVTSLLHDLQQSGRLGRSGGRTELRGDSVLPTAADSLTESLRGRLAMLDAPARDLLQALAAWGSAADPARVGQVAGLEPRTVLRAVRAAVDSGVVRWDGDALVFAHDLYRDAVERDTPDGMRRLLHAAVADELRRSGAIETVVAAHSRLAGGGLDAAETLRAVREDLTFAPEQAIDLLENVPTEPGTATDVQIAVARADALANTGRLAEAQEVARQALAVATAPQARVTLTRVLLHALVSDARCDEALTVVDLARPLAPSPDVAGALDDLRRWTLVLRGTEPVGTARRLRSGDTGSALVADAMEDFLSARCGAALATASRAQDVRHATDAAPWSDGPTAPVWPPWFALYAEGPVVAAELSEAARRDALERHHLWLFPIHLHLAASIDQLAGRLEDAATKAASALEMVRDVGLGWLGHATEVRYQVAILRGELGPAEAALRARLGSGGIDEYGIPSTPWTLALLEEAQGASDAALTTLRPAWHHARETGRLQWLLMAGTDAARIGAETHDGAFVAQVRHDLAAIPLDETPVLAPTVALVQAAVDRDAAAALAASERFAAVGNALGALAGLEEAAVAAAEAGEAEEARTHGLAAIRTARDLGASGVERRVAARLRSRGVRVGATGSRRRPTTGWDSLTPTEEQVVRLVADGMTSPQVARQLYLSPRTVQTHVSHILRKLDASSRVELAAMVARRT
jgi:DNA-binding CsgD family transcriptional regulator/tetratricopeptide (TPR) repeat protein